MAALGRALPLALLVRKPISVVKRSISTSTRLAGIHLFKCFKRVFFKMSRFSVEFEFPRYFFFRTVLWGEFRIVIVFLFTTECNDINSISCQS